MLLCTVRGCGQELARDNRRLVCPHGHAFDMARSGYANLLQPQDRRSRNPGDSAAAVEGRRRLHDCGATAPLFDAVRQTLAASSADVVLDAGCGEGYYLGSLARRSGCQAHGIDISIPAIDAAAKRYPECEWIVANADRFVPYSGGAFSAVMSITARMNGEEFRRVLRPDGRLLLAVPAPDDLVELRGPGRDRTERTVAGFAPWFTLVERSRAATSADLNADAVGDVLHAIYRPLRPHPAAAMRLTFSLDLLLFRPRG